MAVISKDDDIDVNWVRFGSAPLIVTLVLPVVIGVILLLKCIFNHCCVRKSETKEEMFGVEGRMTILPNADAAFLPLSSSQPPPQTLLVQQQLQGASVTVTSDSHKSPVDTSKQQSQTPPFVSNQNPKHPQQPPHERSESQQSHRSSTKSSNAHSTIVVPNVSPSSVSSSAANGHPNVNSNSATSTSADSHQAKDSCAKETVVDLTDSLKRSTLHRQLPDLPQLPQNLQVHHNPPRRSSSVLSHDGTSELYATVGEVPNLNNHPDEVDGSHFYNAAARQSGVVAPAVASTSRGNRSVQLGSSNGVAKSSNARSGSKNEPTPSSDSETYINAAAHHPYAKLKRNIAEHPYARVRTESVGGDETDTDNYDTPQPYAQTGRNHPSSLPLKSATSQNVTDGSGPSSSSGTAQAAGASASSGSASTADMEESSQTGNHPVPPRRTRQWRRSSLPQAQDNQQQQHFSGDSQDSRGYTSISVREPLSSIIATRSQVANTRNYDSHYATVSDDSEEMYAAIEDNDGNYMRIPGEDGEPGSRHWRGGPMVASPIPERREANSPLPPPPIPPLASPPEISSPLLGPSVLSSSVDQAQAPSNVNVNSNPPLYAQVAKKNKKKKAPVTPTSSNPIATNSSSSQPNNVNIASSSANTNEVKLSTNPSSPLSSTPTVSSGQTQSTSAKSRHATSENTVSNSSAAALLSPIESAGSEPRRWSKADISYSEFEVVREPLYNTNISVLAATVSSGSSHGHGHGHSRKKSPERSHHSSKQPLENRVSSEREAPSSKKSHKVKQSQLLDEDNYNVIPDVALTASGRISRNSRDGSGGSGNNSASKSSRKVSASSYNYQEITEVSDSFHISNAYQEIERKEPSDYYQEIGTKLDMSDENGLNDNSNNLYQEIDKATIKREVTRNSIHVDDDDDEDQDDEFYETVKPAASSSTSKGGSGSKYLNVTLASPSHSQASMTSLDRKHGYEKLKKRGSGPTVVVTDILTDYDDDEDEDETKNEDAMYERVKYPPYERLKESRDDLRDIPAEDEEGNENDRNLYEDIGYSRVKPKSRNANAQAGAVTSHNHILPSLQTQGGSSSIQDGGGNSRSSDHKHKDLKDHMKHKNNSSLNEKRQIQGRLGSEGDPSEVEVSNLDQLYARVDKSKKKKHGNPTTTTTTSSSANFNANPSSASASGLNTLHAGSNEGNSNPNNSNEPRMSTASADASGESSQAFILLRTGRDDNSIEYI